MIPGEVIPCAGDIELNPGRERLTLTVANTGDRPIQVGSHYHFYETNAALAFDRETSRGFRLDIPSGTAVRFEPGQQRTVELVELAGDREAWRAGPGRGCMRSASRSAATRCPRTASSSSAMARADASSHAM